MSELLSLKEVASELRQHPETTRRLLTEGKIRGFRIGGNGQWRIERSELERVKRLWVQPVTDEIN